METLAKELERLPVKCFEDLPEEGDSRYILLALLLGTSAPAGLASYNEL